MAFKDEEGDGKPTVTIRYCHYAGDDRIAAQIRRIIEEHLRWVVTLDGSNNPALPRAEQFKVAFNVGNSYLVWEELVHAFSEGNLLGVSVGIRHPERADTRHLIIEVNPS